MTVTPAVFFPLPPSAVPPSPARAVQSGHLGAALHLDLVPGPRAGSVLGRRLPVRHGSRVHVLDQRSAVEDVEQLVSPADAEHRQSGVDRPPRNGQVQVVLGVADVVAGVTGHFAVEPGVQVAAARKDDAVERLEGLFR